ncbi:MAG TPA: ATP-binding protein [Arenicellales bacterium]|nr:ATP-binding protein [Arenicellales bacterium]
MIRSIRTRVLLAASLALAGFLGVTGTALDRAFRSSAESSVRDYLQTQVYGLLAAAELAPDSTLDLPPSLPEPRLSQTNSGLFAWVVNPGGETVWKSPSALGIDAPSAARPSPGEFAFARGATADGQPLHVLTYSVVWQTMEAREVPFLFTVAEDFSLYQSRVNEFRRTLWLWLLGSVVMLIIVQLGALLWVLRPLRGIAEEINSVERGERDRLSTGYPDELQSLASNLNALLANERKQRQRYRDKLDDLAHSLKTPLAVLRNISDKESGAGGHSQQRSNDVAEVMSEVSTQVDRMQDIVSYQLRTSAGGTGEFSLAHPVRPEIDKLARSLDKAYRDRGIKIRVNASDECRFRGDVGDFLEIMGNLMDNACKYCRSTVVVDVAADDSDGELVISVEDDGPGIPEEQRGGILERRVRGDSRTEGQGIGLAIVRGIAEDYGGRVEIDHSGLGGARVVVRLPGAVRR